MMALNAVQMEWAMLMADPDLLQDVQDQKASARDAEAIQRIMWYEKHVTR